MSLSKTKPISTLWERDEAKGPDGTVSVSSANGLVGAEIASRYRLITGAVFRSVRPLYSLLSH